MPVYCPKKKKKRANRGGRPHAFRKRGTKELLYFVKDISANKGRGGGIRSEKGSFPSSPSR